MSALCPYFVRVLSVLFKIEFINLEFFNGKTKCFFKILSKKVYNFKNYDFLGVRIWGDFGLFAEKTAVKVW